MKTAKSSLLLLPLFGLALLPGCDKSNDAPKPAATAASAAPAAGYLDKIKARDKLIVGVFTDKPPFGFVDETGRYVGFATSAGNSPRTCWGTRTRLNSSPWNRPAAFPSCRATRST